MLPAVEAASTLPYRSTAKALLAVAATVAAFAGSAATASRCTLDLATDSALSAAGVVDELLLQAAQARRKESDAKEEVRRSMPDPTAPGVPPPELHRIADETRCRLARTMTPRALSGRGWHNSARSPGTALPTSADP